MDYLDTLLKYTHITKADINQFHFWLRTNPIGKADEDKKDQTRAEMLTMMFCFTGRLTVPDTFDEKMKLSADDLLKEILTGTQQDEKSAFFLFQTLVQAGIIKLTPEPVKGRDFDTETTYVYIAPERLNDVKVARERAFKYDNPTTH